MVALPKTLAKTSHEVVRASDERTLDPFISLSSTSVYSTDHSTAYWWISLAYDADRGAVNEWTCIFG